MRDHGGLEAALHGGKIAAELLDVLRAVFRHDLHAVDHRVDHVGGDQLGELRRDHQLIFFRPGLGIDGILAHQRAVNDCAE